MEKHSIPVQFSHEGIHYEGWATPSDRHKDDGLAKNYHVVLNMVFFGNLSFDKGKWLIDEQRPHELVEAVGRFLHQHAPKEV